MIARTALVRALLGLALLSGAICAPLAASAASIELQTTLGFSNTFRPARWTPLTVTVSNHGPDVSGYLEVRTRDGDDFRNNLFDTTHRRRIDLTRDSRKRMRFTVMLPNVAHPLVIRMVADGRELAVKRIDLRTHFTANRLLLVLSRDANLDYLNDNDGTGIRVLYPHPELLPDQWQGYDAVSALVVHGTSLEQLSTRQYEALRKWIAQGGTLAVSGGADYAWLRTPRMVELLPATPVGMVAITDPASVRRVFARALEISKPFHVNRLATSDAHIAVRAAHIPLVAEKSLGLGRVVYLTFDVARAPFDRWPGMQQTWLELLRIGQAPVLDPLNDATPSPVNELVEQQSADFPGHGTLLIFLALYLSVLVTGYRFAAGTGAARRLLPFATWAAPLLFAPAAYFMFGPLLFDRGASVAMVSVIEPLGDSRYARVQFDLGLHSNRSGSDTGESALALTYTGIEPTLRTPAFTIRQRATSDARSNTATDTDRGTPASWTFSEGAQRALTPDDARRYALHLLEGEDVIDFELHASITVDERGDGTAADRPDTPRIDIDNNSGRALHDAWLIAGDRAWLVGTIAAQGTTTYRIDSEGFALNSRNDEWWDRLERHPQATTRNMLLLKTLIARKDRMTTDAYPGRGTAVLIAATAHPLLITGASVAWQHTARTLVLLPMSAALLVKDESSVTDL